MGSLTVHCKIVPAGMISLDTARLKTGNTMRRKPSEKSLPDIGSFLTSEIRSKSAFSAVHYITQEGGGKLTLQKVRDLLGAGFVAVVGDSGDQPAAVAMDQVCDVGAAVG